MIQIDTRPDSAPVIGTTVARLWMQNLDAWPSLRADRPQAIRLIQRILAVPSRGGEGRGCRSLSALCDSTSVPMAVPVRILISPFRTKGELRPVAHCGTNAWTLTCSLRKSFCVDHPREGGFKC